MTLHLVDKFKQMTNKMKYNTSCECGWMLLGWADAKLMMLMLMASYGWRWSENDSSAIAVVCCSYFYKIDIHLEKLTKMQCRHFGVHYLDPAK